MFNHEIINVDILQLKPLKPICPTKKRHFKNVGIWDIEVFFKACKSYLNLVKEYRGISYDAMNAHVAIVCSRYMMLSVAQRENEDDKTICELCFCLLDEMEDITFSRSMCIIIDALMDTVMEYFHITETQLEQFTTSFIQRLPKYMKEALDLWSKVLIFQGANPILNVGSLSYIIIVKKKNNKKV